MGLKILDFVQHNDFQLKKNHFIGTQLMVRSKNYNNLINIIINLNSPLCLLDSFIITIPTIFDNNAFWIFGDEKKYPTFIFFNELDKEETDIFISKYYVNIMKNYKKINKNHIKMILYGLLHYETRRFFDQVPCITLEDDLDFYDYENYDSPKACEFYFNNDENAVTNYLFDLMCEKGKIKELK